MASDQSEALSAYKREHDLFRGLLDCLQLERDHLVHLNIEALWSLLEEKRQILTALEETRSNIRTLAEEEGIPEKDRSRISSLTKKTDLLREETRARVKENVSFVQDSLDFLDEIFSVVTKGGRQEPSYKPGGTLNQDNSRPLYQREV